MEPTRRPLIVIMDMATTPFTKQKRNRTDPTTRPLRCSSDWCPIYKTPQ